MTTDLGGQAGAPLSILLGADSLLGRRSGIGRVTMEIARVLCAHPGIADFGLLAAGRIRGRDWLDALDAAGPLPALRQDALARFKRQVGLRVPGVHQMHLAKRRLALRREVRDAARRLRAASPLPLVYHEPNMIAQPFDGPTVVEVNDLSWHHDPALHPIERIRWIERNLPRTLRAASRFVAISAFTRDEMAQHMGIAPDRVDVVHLAPAPEFRPMDAAEAAPVLHKHQVADRGYVLSVSTLEPRKNFDRLLRGYLAMPPALRQRTPLLIAGGQGWGTVLSRPDAREAAAAGELRLLGHVADDELVALTARCAAFAYVSLYEGFGLPVVEAMATGVPVLASATTATGEVAGDAAVLVDPLDEAAINEGLRRLLEQPEARPGWAAASLRRAAQFSWRATVDGMAASWRAAAG